MADKLISHTWIQVHISPSYSLCDLRQMDSSCRTCLLICPLGVSDLSPGLSWKSGDIMFAIVCCHHASVCVKRGIHMCIAGWSCWALLWPGTSHLIARCSCSGSKKRQNVGSEGARGLKRLSSSSIQGDSTLSESSLGSFQVSDKR